MGVVVSGMKEGRASLAPPLSLLSFFLSNSHQGLPGDVVGLANARVMRGEKLLIGALAS